MLPSAFRIAQTEVTTTPNNSTKGYLTATPTKTTNTDSLIFNDSVYVDPTGDGRLVTKNLLLEGSHILFQKQHPTSASDDTLKTTVLSTLRCFGDNLYSDGYGFGTYLGAGGLTVVGGGEASQSVYNNLTDLGIRNESEQLYLTSDGNINFLTNCQSWADRKSMTFDVNGVLTAPSFTGPLTGNASTATKLATARTINGISFDGTKNITVADSTKLPLAGGTLTGVVNPLQFVSSGRSSSWNVILNADEQISLIKQTTYTGYFPIMNLQTNDGRVGVGTYTSGLYFSYFLADNATNSADNQVWITKDGLYCSGLMNARNGLAVTGAITATGTITGSLTYNAVWNDYAEYFPRGENTEPGDIIALNDSNDPKELYVRATRNSLRVVGVHSDTFGHIIGGEAPTDTKTNFKEYNKDKYIPVGLIGRVDVKVIGKVTKGAFIVPSDIPGVGKIYDPEYDAKDHIVGYLVESDNLDNVVRRLKMKIR